MNTTENNKLIAEFMGMSYDYHGQPNKYWELTDEQSFASNNPYPQDRHLNFHTSWNWLMEVVERIEALGYSVQPLFNSCYIAKKEGYTYKIKVEQQDKKIDAVYNACVEFIKWYNIEILFKELEGKGHIV